MYVRAIKIGQKTLGHNHPDVAKGLSDRAGLFKSQVRMPTSLLYCLLQHAGLLKAEVKTIYIVLGVPWGIVTYPFTCIIDCFRVRNIFSVTVVVVKEITLFEGKF